MALIGFDCKRRRRLGSNEAGFLVVLGLVCVAPAFAQSYEVLSKQSFLFPQGTTRGIYFDAGTETSLNEKNEVIVGTLSNDAFLFPQGTTTGRYFKAHTQVKFNTRGEVIFGTLASDAFLFPNGSTRGIYFQSGCPIFFGYNGEVLSGVLQKDEYLFPYQSSTGIYFKGGCRVEFANKGEVEKGTLQKDTYLFGKGSTSGAYYKAGSHVTFAEKGEVLDVYRDRCLCNEDAFVVDQPVILKEINDIIAGRIELKDRTVLHVLQRNTWPSNAAAIDVTASMDPYVAQIYMWLKLNVGRSQTIFYTFFNDGDRKEDRIKMIGSAGGLYGTNSNSLTSLLRVVAIAKANGNGGDYPENDIEAILYTIRKAPTCKSIIHVADNKATPRDMSLLSQVTRPVHVIVCGVDDQHPSVNPALLDIAHRTGGTIHTIEEDITGLSGMAVGEHVTVGGYDYRLTADGFEHVK